MSLREDREYLAKRKAEANAIKEAAIAKQKEEFNQSVIDRENLRLAHEAKIDKFYKYKDDVKKTLIKKVLTEIYTGSITNINSREEAICENLMDQYIGEMGTTELMKLMRFSENSMLRRTYDRINEACKKITKEANADDEMSQTISSGDINEFWKDIDKEEDIEDMTNTIRLRVANAEEEFVNKNAEDKADIKTILKDTADRVDAAKGSNDNEYETAVEESESRIAKDMIYQIQHSRSHNVFDRMVRNLSEVALTNEDAKQAFTTDGGRLDLDKIVESARCMYTMLEMVSTIGLEKVDNKYIEDTLKSIK